jgi:hypothetical protein
MTRLVGLLAICTLVVCGAALGRLVGLPLDAALYTSITIVILAIQLLWRRASR